MMALGLAVGQQYESFESVKDAIEKYEAENFVVLIITDCKKVDCATSKKRYGSVELNSNLKYSLVKFACHHGGKAFKSKSTGLHQNGTTCKIGCKFHFRFRATADGQQLELSHFYPTHNHPISETAWKHHIKNRKLSKSVESEIAEHLKLKPNRKYLRDSYAKNRVVTLSPPTSAAGVRSPSWP